jgi:membrane-associated HD superfamily phosphohydrolase
VGLDLKRKIRESITDVFQKEKDMKKELKLDAKKMVMFVFVTIILLTATIINLVSSVVYENFFQAVLSVCAIMLIFTLLLIFLFFGGKNE